MKRFCHFMEQWLCSLDEMCLLYAIKLQPVSEDPSKLIGAFKDFVDSAYKYGENMTPEAASFLREREKTFIGLLEHINNKTPDGLEKRRLNRLISATRGQRLVAQKLVENFPRLSESNSLIEEGQLAFVEALQRLLDFMHDISDEIHQGPANFARINLLYWAIDELTGANFLTRRGYTTLAYAHLRCVMEIIDKVELFGKDPSMAEVWASSESEYSIWQKLRPAKVRKLLGREPSDPIYSLFSHRGSHPTFTAVQTRITKKEQKGDILNVGIGVGGKKNPEEQAALMGFCILLTNLCTMHASLAFPTDLSAQEIIHVAKNATDEQLKFLENLSKAYPDTDKGSNTPIGILIRGWQAIVQKQPTNDGLSTQ